MKVSWIECKRRQSRKGLTVRLRADFVTAVVETLTKEGDKFIPGVRLHLGNNNHIDVIDETVDSVWNKLAQATSSNMPVIDTVSPDYPGHPDYGQAQAA